MFLPHKDICFVNSQEISKDARLFLNTLPQEAIAKIRGKEYLLDRYARKAEDPSLTTAEHLKDLRSSLVGLREIINKDIMTSQVLYESDLTKQFNKDGLVLRSEEYEYLLSQFPKELAEDLMVLYAPHLCFFRSCIRTMLKATNNSLKEKTIKRGRPSNTRLKVFAFALAGILEKNGHPISSSSKEIFWTLFAEAVNYYGIKNVKTRTYIEFALARKSPKKI